MSSILDRKVAMPVKQHEVQLRPATGETVRAVLVVEDCNYRERDRCCLLRLRYQGKELVAAAGDYFEALCRIRGQLEEEDLRPICYGASRNVYPSGMCRSMGPGLKAYRNRLGEPAMRTDLVHIFESGPDVEPASIEEQKEFHEKWLASVRARET